MKRSRILFFGICFNIFILGCDDSTNHKTQEQQLSLEQEKWLFNTQYIKTINDSSWEKLTLKALNNYEDFKVDFTYISTGKPQTCGLYGKGVLVNNTIYGENKAHNKRKFLMRPNLIPKVTILFIQDYKQSQGNFIYLEISDMVDFIKSCGDAHQYAVGKYNAVQ